MTSAAAVRQPSPSVALPPLGRMPSGSIQITRIDFPLLQQKIFSSIVYAVTTGAARRVHPEQRHGAVKVLANMGLVDWCIEAHSLRKLSHFNSNNYAAFDAAISGLNGRVVNYNILGKDREKTLVCPECQAYMLQEGEPIGGEQLLVCPACKTKVARKVGEFMTTVYASSVLFDTIATHQGVVYFSFGRLMTYFLEKAKSRFYCKLLPDMANGLSRGSSHALYLLLLDYIDEKKGAGQLPFVDVETFAKLVGGEKYTNNFKDLRVNVIEPSIKEISEHTNIEALFDQEYDTKKTGRKISALRIRGVLKRPAQHQLPGLEDEETEILGFRVKTEEFLDFLSRNAKEKHAYKNTMRLALQTGTLENLRGRLDEFLAHKEEERLKNNAEHHRAETRAFYESLDLIAQQSKRCRIHELHVRDLSGNFFSFSSLLDDGRFHGVAAQIVAKSRAEIEALLFTEHEKRAQELDEADRYDREVIPALLQIAPVNCWSVVIDGEACSLAYPMPGFRYPLLPIRRALSVMQSGNGEVSFEALGRLYSPSFDGSGFQLTPITDQQGESK